MRIGQLVLSVALFLAVVSTVRAQEPATAVTPPRTGPHELTLMAALELTLKHNPALAASAEEVRARDVAAMQAGLLPNPDLTIEIENLAGQDDLSGFDGAETTLSLSQLIELGGKRHKRRQLAALEKDLAGWDYQSQRLDVLTAVTKAFIRLLVAQEQRSQSEELVHLAEQTRNAVAARVEAGKVPPLEKTRSEVELTTARTEAGRAQRELLAARARLTSFWGPERADFSRAIGDLTAIAPLPDETFLQGALDSNPDLARWSSELKRHEKALSLARAQSLPDLTFSLGVRNFRESDNNALVAGVELPLPLFDRNQGGVGEARARLEKARRERRAAESEAGTGLEVAWQNLAAAHMEATTLRDEILPGAKDAFDAADLGYREGKLDYLQMLDAQRTLSEAKGQYLQALSSYHQARTEVERLIGAPMNELTQPISRP